MYYVYLLQSISNPSKRYIGFTENLEQRLEVHNSGGSVHTKAFRPWKMVVFVAFEDEEQAKAFERYLKIGSGWTFAKRHLWPTNQA